MRSLYAIAVVSIALACSVPAMAQTTDAPAPEATTPAPAEAPAEKPAEAAPAPAAEAPAPAAPVADTGSGEPAYVGTWADDPAQCGKAQDTDEAPMVITKDRFDQHEAHCEFTSVSGNANEWKVTSKCSVEGDEQVYEFGMSVADKTLAMVDDAGTHIYSRCE
jgi:hypothetical protein